MAEDQKLDRIEKTVVGLQESFGEMRQSFAEMHETQVEMQKTQVEMQKEIVGIHRAVVVIETVHGRKLDLLFEGLEAVKSDVHEIKVTLGLLKSIANDHERRLDDVERTVREHMALHHNT